MFGVQLCDCVLHPWLVASPPRQARLALISQLHALGAALGRKVLRGAALGRLVSISSRARFNGLLLACTQRGRTSTG